MRRRLVDSRLHAKVWQDRTTQQSRKHLICMLLDVLFLASLVVLAVTNTTETALYLMSPLMVATIHLFGGPALLLVDDDELLCYLASLLADRVSELALGAPGTFAGQLKVLAHVCVQLRAGAACRTEPFLERLCVVCVLWIYCDACVW